MEKITFKNFSDEKPEREKNNTYRAFVDGVEIGRVMGCSYKVSHKNFGRPRTGDWTGSVIDENGKPTFVSPNEREKPTPFSTGFNTRKETVEAMMRLTNTQKEYEIEGS